MTSDIIARLRKQIEEEHQEALRALEVLKRFVDATPVAATPAVPATRKTPKHDVAKLVFAALSNQWMTVDELTKKTQLEKNQVRNALYFKSHREKIERRKISTRTEYRLRESATVNEDIADLEMKEDDNA